jgi:hypothetical protein
MREIPTAAKASMCHCNKGLPPAGNKGLGQWSVKGRMRSPRPAANIIAFI